MRAVLVPLVEALTVVDVPDDLILARELLGGWVEVVRTPDVGHVLLVDEDGGPKRLAPNARASGFAGRLIVGPALIVGADLTDATDPLLQHLGL